MSLFATLALGAAIISAQSPATTLNSASTGSNITRKQAVERADRLFQLLDINHDGILTKSEAEAEGAKLMAQRFATGTDIAPGIGGHTLRYFQRTFATMPSATRSRFEQAMLVHFDDMDKDHDGILTPAERLAGRNEMAGGQ